MRRAAAVGGASLVAVFALGHFRGGNDWHHRRFLPTRSHNLSRQSAIFMNNRFSTAERNMWTAFAADRVFTKAEVAKHCGPTGTLLVTFNGKVYDVTSWAESHPGGRDKILLAAGGALEPYFSIYGSHLSPDTLEILESFRVGVLDRKEAEEEARKAAKLAENDPYGADPVRSPLLTVHSVKPFNAEPPTIMLADRFVTPTDALFVRNHLPVPTVDVNSYQLTVGELPPAKDDKSSFHLTLSLNDLQDEKRFPQHQLVATQQCAGNRRREFNERTEPVRGLAWQPAAIGTAVWRGVWLRDVLASAGVTVEKAEQSGWNHVVFEGADHDPTGTPYKASIPIRKALSLECDVMVAFEMNGQPIPRDHGFPVRLVAPGVVGARSVKWLDSIKVSADEADSLWQLRDYRVLPSDVREPRDIDFEYAPAIQDLPVTSAITSPVPSATSTECHGGLIPVKGYAFSGGGRGIVRVEVSADGGKTWHGAQILDADEIPKLPSGSKRNWAWRLWEVEVPAPQLAAEGVCAEIQLVCRAVDTDYNMQPKDLEDIWNVRGLLNNSWHRVTIRAESN